MITAFGNFGLELAPSFCTEVYFDGGDFGGSATFLQCGTTRFTTINLNPYDISFSYCVESESIQTSGSVNAALLGICEGTISNPGSSNPDDPGLDDPDDPGFNP
jgi:hypothetical protein